MAGFTFKKPESQRIIVSGWSDGRHIQFVGVFCTYTEDELKAIYGEIELAQADLTSETANSSYFRIADRLMIGWVNDPEGDPNYWVTEDDETTPLDSTEQLKQQMLGQGSVAYCVCEAFYRARQSSDAQLGNSKPSPAHGFSEMAKAGKRKT